MRFVIRFFLVLIIVTALILVTVVVMAIEDSALVPVSDGSSSRDFSRAKQLFARYDPRKLKAGAVKNAEIGVSDLNLLAIHAVHLIDKGGATVEVGRGWLKARASLALPRNPIGDFFNVEADLRAAGGLVEFQRLRLGSIEIPGRLANFAAVKALNTYFEGQGTVLVGEFIESVDFEPNGIRVAYRWPSDAVERVRAHIVSPQSGERLQAFNDRLVATTGTFRRGAAVPLLAIMKPLFELAQERSAEAGAAADNRAAIVVLSMYVNGRSVAVIVPEVADGPAPKRVSVTLHGRVDFAQHYLTSAALTALGSGELSNAVGLFKEVEDSRGGSGFSFTDLAADRAGTRFAELATASDASARRTQLRIAQSQSATDIMPDVHDLAEGMSESEFQQRDGGIESPAYRRVTRDIEQRIDATRLFR